MLEAAMLARKFKFGCMTLADPDPSMSPIEVRDFLSAAYPEITNAVIGEPEAKGGHLVYTMNVPVREKG